MNDRLGDLGDEVPAWALGDSNTTTTTAAGRATMTSQGDIELGHYNGNGHNSSGEAPGWMNASDDFQVQPTGTRTGQGQQQGGQQPSQQNNESETIMKTFFNNVDIVKETIEAISNATNRIKDIQEKTKFATMEADEKKLSVEAQNLIQGTNVKAKSAKRILGLLRDENKKYEQEGTLNASDLRKRENLVNTLTRKFIDEMKEYQNSQQSYKVTIKNKAVQQIRYVKEDATPQEIEEIMKSEGGREGMFKQSFLQGGVNESIKQTYTKVAGKYQDILALEQSVAELHQMFLDFALLTEQQGELIDQIEFNVKSAADYVEDANVDVFHAIESSKKIRKKQCLIIIIVIVVTIIVLFSFRILP